MKRWKRIWSGALPLFLGFWALMLAVLAVVTIGSQKADMQNQAENARHAVAEQYREVWAGDAAEEKKKLYPLLAAERPALRRRRDLSLRLL